MCFPRRSRAVLMQEPGLAPHYRAGSQRGPDVSTSSTCMVERRRTAENACRERSRGARTARGASDQGAYRGHHQRCGWSSRERSSARRARQSASSTSGRRREGVADGPSIPHPPQTPIAARRRPAAMPRSPRGARPSQTDTGDYTDRPPPLLGLLGGSAASCSRGCRRSRARNADRSGGRGNASQADARERASASSLLMPRPSTTS